MGRWNVEEVFEKIDWEGGVGAAIEWGIKGYNLPLEFSDEWDAVAEKYRTFEKAWEKLKNRMDPDGKYW